MQHFLYSNIMNKSRHYGCLFKHKHIQKGANENGYKFIWPRFRNHGSRIYKKTDGNHKFRPAWRTVLATPLFRRGKRKERDAIKTVLVQLQKVIKHFEKDRDLLKQFLSSFSYSDNKDIEWFLHNKAVEFEKLSKSRPYLICKENELQNSRLEQITIYGYISVTFKTLSIPDNASNRIQKALDRFSSKICGKADLICLRYYPRKQFLQTIIL